MLAVCIAEEEIYNAIVARLIENGADVNVYNKGNFLENASHRTGGFYELVRDNFRGFCTKNGVKLDVELVCTNKNRQ